MTAEQGTGEGRDQFPVGLRVLAVDDDPTCLLLLETLLRRCQYHATTTSQAITALKMLRENRNRFDLVISDVHMPDMDGFKLLELVGLEMDLPVIMLSANSDPKLVMKGITHGACDYLLKPVRIEELKNIWQHVIRRKKHDKRDSSNIDNQDKPQSGTFEAIADQKLNKKRKDQNEDDDEDHGENGHENEDPTSQKKPRVVWSVDLHRKFVAAVNQLGIDKAVPKKILDMMNVDKLTRENVASHLQKYRLYLKRISTVANQQANMVAALGSTDASYLQMNSMNGLGLHNFTGHGKFQTTPFRTLPPGGMLGRLNSPAGLGMHGLPSPGAIQLGHAATLGHSVNSQSHFQTTANPGNNGNILQGMQISLELDRLQSNKGFSDIRELPSHIDDTTAFPVSSGFSDVKISVGSSNAPFLHVPNKTPTLGGESQGGQEALKFGRQTSIGVTAIESGFSSHFSDHGRCDGIWSNNVQSSGENSNSFTLGDCFKQANLHPGDVRDSMSAMALQSGGNLSNVSSISSLPIHLLDYKADVQCQVTSINGNPGQIAQSNCQGWDDNRLDALYNSNAACSTRNAMIPINGIGSPIGQNLDTNNTNFHQTTNSSSIGQPDIIDPSLMKHNHAGNPATETLLRSNEAYMISQQKMQGNYASNNFGSLEDMVSAMVKQEQDKLKFTEGDFGSGNYPLRTCI